MRQRHWYFCTIRVNKSTRHTMLLLIYTLISIGFLRPCEKFLGNLRGLFSKTWKSTKTRTITGPVTTRVRTKGNQLEQRERWGLTVMHNGRSNVKTTHAEPTNTLQKVELEKAKQDNSLSDLSNLLEELKDMAVGMGSVIDRQNKGLNPFMDDVEELNFRVSGAYQRGRRLLGK